MYLTEQSKDVIDGGDIMVTPLEVEGIFLTHPAIREVATVGLADERIWERGCVFINLRPEKK